MIHNVYINIYVCMYLSPMSLQVVGPQGRRHPEAALERLHGSSPVPRSETDPSDSAQIETFSFEEDPMLKLVRERTFTVRVCKREKYGRVYKSGLEQPMLARTTSGKMQLEAILPGCVMGLKASNRACGVEHDPPIRKRCFRCKNNDYIFMYVQISLHIHIHTHTHIHLHIHIYSNKNGNKPAIAITWINICIYRHTCIHTCMYMYMYMYMYM